MFKWRRWTNHSWERMWTQTPCIQLRWFQYHHGIPGLFKILRFECWYVTSAHIFRNGMYERSQNFWSPKQQRRGLRISDPPSNTAEESEFLTPQTTQERTQNFWSPKQHRREVRISDPPNNTGEESEFLIPQTTQERSQNFWTLKQHRIGLRISNPPKNKRKD